MKISTGLANHMLATGALKAALNGGEIRVFAGTIPATADAATDGAVLIGTYKEGGSGTLHFDADASGGALAKSTSEVWSGTAAAAGTATFYRHVMPADDNGASPTAIRIQGTCGLVGSDMIMTTTVFSISDSLPPLETYILQLPLSY